MTTYNPNTITTNCHPTYGAIPPATVLTTGISANITSNTITGSITQPSAHFHSGNGTAIMTIPHGEDKVVIEERAALEVKGQVLINGLDLEERLKTIEKVLAIPERDVELETKHPKLKKLFDEYIHALEKYRTWGALNNE